MKTNEAKVQTLNPKPKMVSDNFVVKSTKHKIQNTKSTNKSHDKPIKEYKPVDTEVQYILQKKYYITTQILEYSKYNSNLYIILHIFSSYLFL